MQNHMHKLFKPYYVETQNVHIDCVSYLKYANQWTGVYLYQDME